MVVICYTCSPLVEIYPVDNIILFLSNQPAK